MKIVRVATLSALMALVLSVPASASHRWGTYHWKRTSTEITPPIYTTLADPGRWASHVDRAVTDWNRGHPSHIDRIQSTNSAGGGSPKACRVNTGQILVCATRYGDTGWLGLAQIWTSGGHIVKGITKLNDTYFDRPPYNTSAWRSMVTCQEIGHDYGLGHVNVNFDDLNTGSCMDYTNDPSRNDGNGTNEYPNEHDFQELASIYQHSDSSTSASSPAATNFGVREVGQRPPQGGGDSDVGGDSPADWGRPVHHDGYGRPDVFVQDLAGGMQKVTHVFWTLEHNRRGSHDNH